jgi:hypothetical protein
VDGPVHREHDVSDEPGKRAALQRQVRGAARDHSSIVPSHTPPNNGPRRDRTGASKTCHGVKLRRTGAMPDLKEQKADGRARFDQMVMGGRGQMPAWQGIIGANELDQLWAYIRSRANDR